MKQVKIVDDIPKSCSGKKARLVRASNLDDRDIGDGTTPAIPAIVRNL